MKITGLVVEYNPLHNGHLHHIAKTKEITNCDYLVGVMSGNFVQRGEPAFVNKWARTEMALKAGIDLVLELPLKYSISSAEGFAHGAVSTLNNLGIVDSICFGSEVDNLDLLRKVSYILADEPLSYKVLLQNYLKEGISFPAAREKALLEYFLENAQFDIDQRELSTIISSSNNILGIEYLKAIYRLSANIVPYSIKRISNSYNEKDLTGSISSATSIRANFHSKAIIDTVPYYTHDILTEEIKQGRGPITLDSFSDLILYKLRDSSIEEIKNLLDVSEGLEHKIKKAAETETNIYSLIESVKNKRYTATRIQRILIYSLLNITKEFSVSIKKPVEYIHVLGFNQNGKMLLRKASKLSSVPIITNPAPKDELLLGLDVKATDVYVLGYKSHENKIAKQDFQRTPVIM
jgi:predicted nucleotidyltransferase